MKNIILLFGNSMDAYEIEEEILEIKSSAGVVVVRSFVPVDSDNLWVTWGQVYKSFTLVFYKSSYCLPN